MKEFRNVLFMQGEVVLTDILNCINLCRNIPKLNSCRLPEPALLYLLDSAPWQVHVVHQIWRVTLGVSQLSFILKKATMIWSGIISLYFLSRMQLSFLILYMRLSLNRIMKYHKRHLRMISFGILFR